MHQILGLRPFFSEKTQKWEVTDGTFFKRNWRVQSIAELFENLDKYLKPIPSKERFNLFYTVAFCGDGKRQFREQNVIIFDIDKIDQKCKATYIEIVCTALGIEKKETGIVDSGNGLHFVVGLEAPIADESYFEANRRHYNALCEKINLALKKNNLPGDADPAVFDPRRIMRLPGTENRKEGKETKKCKLLQPIIVARDFDIRKLSGLPDVAATEQVSAQALKKYPTPDTTAILDGCDYLKWCKENPNDVRENQWYAMLSIVGRLPPNGRDLAHEYSRGHHSYSEAETDSKIDQALAASGPRTCDNLDRLASKCQGCKYRGKVTSPIMIQGEDYISTKDTGFYTVSIDAGGTVRRKPNFEDLRKFFERETNYVTMGGSGVVYVYNGTHFEEYPDGYLKTYAHTHFDPKSTAQMRSEFKDLVTCTNPKAEEWFNESIKQKMNFKNGVLDLNTMELLPHSPQYGFRYCLDYNYEPQAKAPRFEKFMSEIMNDKQALVDILLEFAGYCFSNDDCWTGKALILTGDGANGKSTFMDVLKHLAGDANTSKVSLSDINKDATLRKMLDGKLFNLAEETPTHSLLDSTIFKSIVTGGDMSVKMLYKQPYTIPNRTKFIFACNELPRTRDTSRGFTRRLIIVPFNREFEGDAKDPFIKQKLFAELPGIFNLVIAAYKKLLDRQRFQDSPETDTELSAYQRETDTVRAWYLDCVEAHVVEPTSEILQSLSSMYASYRQYAEMAGDKPEPMTTVARRLRRLLPNYHDRKFNKMIKGQRQVVFRGVRFTEEGDY